MYTFDSYAWLEYFLAGRKSQEVKEIIDSKEEISTPAIVLSELKVRLVKDKINEKQIGEIIEFVILRSKVININKEISLFAADYKIKLNLYLIDALVYASALSVNSELLTGDQHLKGLEKVKFLD